MSYSLKMFVLLRKSMFWASCHLAAEASGGGVRTDGPKVYWDKIRGTQSIDQCRFRSDSMSLFFSLRADEMYLISPQPRCPSKDQLAISPSYPVTCRDVAVSRCETYLFILSEVYFLHL